MEILEGESIISNLDNNKIVLTNLRLIKKVTENDKLTIDVIFLEDIALVDTEHSRENSILYIGILVAGIVIMFSFFEQIKMFKNAESIFLIGIIILIVFAIWWYFSKKHILKFVSKGGGAVTYTNYGLSQDEIEQFISALQKAKYNRVNHLCGITPNQE